MQLIDLFSGFGAFSLAGKQVWGDELEILGFSEIEEYPIKVYEKNFPGVKSLGDIKELDGRTIKFSGPYIITGGFPCPPFSNAGHRKGQADDRFIWPEMVRIISEAKPTWVVAENVLGIISMGIDDCLCTSSLWSWSHPQKKQNFSYCTHQGQRGTNFVQIFWRNTQRVHGPSFFRHQHQCQRNVGELIRNGVG